MRNEFTIREKDVLKANICLAGIISVFLVLTLIAFLCTDGRPYCIIPLLRKCCPSCKWVVEHDSIEAADEKLLILKVGLAQHVLGVKRPCRQV